MVVVTVVVVLVNTSVVWTTVMPPVYPQTQSDETSVITNGTVSGFSLAPPLNMDFIYDNSSTSTRVLGFTRLCLKAFRRG